MAPKTLLKPARESLSSTCLSARGFTRSVVGPGGLEPPTSRLSGVCSNQLSYRPLKRHVPDREVKNTRSHHSLNRSAAVFYGKRNEDGDTLHLFSVIERTNRA